MFKFQSLKVWDKAIDYSRELFKISHTIPRKFQFSFTDQLIRATLSITNNIAEGSGRKSSKESKQFFNIAKGSVYETVNILIMAKKENIIMLSDQKSIVLYDQAEEICRMLTGLMNH